ncbi:collagen alpha-1(X) chain-like [Macrobrachium nipponense]|uniref:collagen alpha-1(X) chain-like n=1 Tax=Macrobrachium nipponense TaxID=159736 RepID=UPI0030C8AC01
MGPGTDGRGLPRVTGRVGEAHQVFQDGWTRPVTCPGMGGRGPPRVPGRTGEGRHGSQDGQARPATGPCAGRHSPPCVPGRRAWTPLSRDGQAWTSIGYGTGGRCLPLLLGRVTGRAGKVHHVSRDGRASSATGLRTARLVLPLVPGQVTGRVGKVRHMSHPGMRPATCPGMGGRGPPHVPEWAGEAHHMSLYGRARSAMCPGLGGQSPPHVPGRVGEARHGSWDRWGTRQGANQVTG